MNNLKNIQIAGDGKFIINDSIIVYDIELTDTGIAYSIDYDDKLYTKDYANAISEEFIQATIKGILANLEE